MNKAEFKNEIYNLCKENKYNPANLFLEIDKLIDDFSKTQTTKGGQVDLLVMPLAIFINLNFRSENGQRWLFSL